MLKLNNQNMNNQRRIEDYIQYSIQTTSLPQEFQLSLKTIDITQKKIDIYDFHFELDVSGPTLLLYKPVPLALAETSSVSYLYDNLSYKLLMLIAIG